MHYYKSRIRFSVFYVIGTISTYAVVCGGIRRVATIPTNTPSRITSQQPTSGSPGEVDISKLVCVQDYAEAAAKVLNENALAYFRVGADEQITLRDNILAYKRLTMRPRNLVDVSHRDISTTILGRRVDIPIGISPVSLLGLASPTGDIDAAKAAEEMGTIFILGIASNQKMEDIALATPNLRKWLQVFIFNKRELTVRLIRRAEAAGFEAIVVNIDTPVPGKRRELQRLPFQLPANVTLANFGPEEAKIIGITDRPLTIKDGFLLLDSSLTWQDIDWVKSITKLPVFLKGILSPDDADTAASRGIDGVYISSQGGRQLDTVPATIDVLPEIARRVRGRCPIIMDGGLQVGTDIFKALALGANMVFSGRGVSWGLAVDGERGAKTILNFYKDEFNSTMALAGVTRVDQINENYVGRSMNPQPMIYCSSCHAFTRR